MQKYTYHTHNNFDGVFDGRSTCEEMISKACELGFEQIGVSNHLVYHQNVPLGHRMFFNDFKRALDVYKRSYDEIERVSSLYNINVLKGFEVDFFPSKEWRNSFEIFIKELKPDYLIGSTHFIRDKYEHNMYNIYHLDSLPANITKEDLNELLLNYWNNIIESVKSGYFNFIAHMDYCTQFDLCIDEKWNDIKYKLIDTLKEYNQAFEINTSGIRRIGRPFPDRWIIDDLIKSKVPVLISDDAHSTDILGCGFDIAEDYLNKYDCIRYKI
ncbi:MAG: histidinol-phosphatase HisJ family protein [Alphaproteobacteria bacterium]|nr:histidinol-phosphatase HisJ family protein [Alphaproteobacteria bacterium]